MLQINFIRENKDNVIKGLTIRNFKSTEFVAEVLQLDEERRKVKNEFDTISAASNAAAKKIGDLMRNGNKEAAENIKNQSASYKEQIKNLGTQLEQLEQKVHQILVQFPNLPYHLVKEGNTAEDNEIIFTHGNPENLNTGALPHWELAAKYDIIDFELGNKVAGAGFPVYKGKGARLQRALINFFLDQAVAQNYFEVQIPHVVNEASGYGTGQLPDKEGQMYHIGIDDLYLIPTAEVPITNLYRNIILKEEDFPIKNVGYSPCFRREAGSYGAHVRGLNRLHQFEKVEIVRVEHPDKSYQALEEMTTHVKNLLEQLGLHYRILRLCGGDMSFSAALTYDMEVWSAAQQRWLEVSSISNCETFQSNRLKLRFKNKEGKTQLAHTLNGSALALPRIVAALLENNQDEKGIKIPKVLVPYTGFDYIH